MPTSPSEQAWLACLMELAAWQEAEFAERARIGQEPAYHNRLHVADALVALNALLLATLDRTRWATPKQSNLVELNHSNLAQPSAKAAAEEVSQAEHSLACHQMCAASGSFPRAVRVGLLAMLGHDLLHLGRLNHLPAELERRSVDALMPLMLRHHLPADDVNAIAHLIYLTEARVVPAVHSAAACKPFRLDDLDCLAVLLVEADILASALPSTGPGQAQRLQAEWATVYPEKAKAVRSGAGRLFFLQQQALFSSPASRQLGLPTQRQRQIRRLIQSGRKY